MAVSRAGRRLIRHTRAIFLKYDILIYAALSTLLSRGQGEQRPAIITFRPFRYQGANKARRVNRRSFRHSPSAPHRRRAGYVYTGAQPLLPPDIAECLLPPPRIAAVMLRQLIALSPAFRQHIAPLEIIDASIGGVDGGYRVTFATISAGDGRWSVLAAYAAGGIKTYFRGDNYSR